MNAKDLQAEIEQSLLSAAQTLFKTQEWKLAALSPLREQATEMQRIAINSMLRACAGNLAQGLADRTVEDCENEKDLITAFKREISKIEKGL